MKSCVSRVLRSSCSTLLAAYPHRPPLLNSPQSHPATPHPPVCLGSLFTMLHLELMGPGEGKGEGTERWSMYLMVTGQVVIPVVTCMVLAFYYYI